MADAEKLYSNLPKNRASLVAVGYMVVFSLVLVILLVLGVLPREQDPAAMRVLIWAIPVFTAIVAGLLCLVPYGYTFDGSVVTIKSLAKKTSVNLADCEKVALTERIANLKGESVERIVLVTKERAYVVVGFAPDFPELRDAIVSAAGSENVLDTREKEKPKDAG